MWNNPSKDSVGTNRGQEFGGGSVGVWGLGGGCTRLARVKQREVKVKEPEIDIPAGVRYAANHELLSAMMRATGVQYT